MKKIQLLVKLGQIFALISIMWSGPLPKALAQDLTASSNVPTVNFDDTDTGAIDWRLTANNGANKFSLEQVNNGVPFTIEAGAPNNALYITSLGRLGVRTSVPFADIHIKNGSAATIYLEQDVSGGPEGWGIIGDNISYKIQDVKNGRVPFAIGLGAPIGSLVIDGTGNVGLKTAVPEANLHINGGASSDVFNGIGPDPAGDSGESAFNFGYSGFSFGRGSGFFNARPDPGAVAPNPSVRFMTGNIQRMIIANNGNVGIGQFGAVVGSNPGTSPLAKLHVQGSILVEGGSFIDDGVTLNVPDYVFEPDYKLMPLQELAAYIEKEKHLPEILPAREMKEQGVNLGAMQMQLLKKVEELTLYTIQQDKKFMELQGQNQKLAAENAQLQSRLSAVEAVIKKLGQQEP